MHCCPDMARQVEHACEQHPDPFECPDALMCHSPRTGLYGIIVRDGGSSSVTIRHCPWCGATLPADRPASAPSDDVQGSPL